MVPEVPMGPVPLYQQRLSFPPQTKLDSIGKKLTKVVSHQNHFQARESRHRHTLESNYRRVTWWSLLEIGVIVAVGVIQVFVIRSLFRSNRKDRIKT